MIDVNFYNLFLYNFNQKNISWVHCAEKIIANSRNFINIAEIIEEKMYCFFGNHNSFNVQIKCHVKFNSNIINLSCKIVCRIRELFQR